MSHKIFPFSEQDVYDMDLKYGSPLYVYDADLIEINCKHFLKTFRKYFPDFRNFFAVKALPNPEILKIINNTGMDFDASSPTELWLLNKINIDPEKIMYTSNYTSCEDIDYAFKNKVIVNLDDIDGLNNFYQLYSTEHYNLDLICFRLNPLCGKTDSETKSNILGGEFSKFGTSPDNILEAYIQAKKFGFKRFGLHCMTGSNILDINYWNELLEAVYPTIKILQDNNINLEFLNIGGGIGIPYKETDKKINLDKLAKTIKNKMDELNKKYEIKKSIKLFMECGRYITGPYGWLITKCESIKNSNNKTFYGINGSMANLMRPGMYDSYHHISTINSKYNKKNMDKICANIVGTLCENNDWFARNRYINKVEKGDYIIFHDVGAHGHAMGFNYNGKLRSAEVMGYRNELYLIRKHETPEYLYHNCDFNNDNNYKYKYIYAILMIILTIYNIFKNC
jgi:diaminopimelate decarboxylase